MSRLALMLVLLLPFGARAQSLEQTLEELEGASAWQPTWRFACGVVALGGGAALLSLSVAYGDRVLKIEDRAIAAGEAAQVAVGEDELLRLRNRIDHLNQQGSDLETLHLATLVSGALLFAGGIAAIVWDRLRDPEPFAVALYPMPSGVAVRLDW